LKYVELHGCYSFLFLSNDLRTHNLKNVISLEYITFGPNAGGLKLNLSRAASQHDQRLNNPFRRWTMARWFWSSFPLDWDWVQFDSWRTSILRQWNYHTHVFVKYAASHFRILLLLLTKAKI